MEAEEGEEENQAIAAEESEVKITAEQRLARLGARIDALIAKAIETRTRVTNKLENVDDPKEVAIQELEFGMERAWGDLNLVWSEIKEEAEKIADRHQDSEDEEE